MITSLALAAAVLLSFDVHGPEDGEPLMLVHGFPDDRHTWDAMVPELAKDRRVVVPDLRGYGESPRPPDGYGMDDLSGDLIALADHLGWTDFDLVGHDWGAALAWWTAMHHPQRLRTLTVLDVGHPMAWEQFWAVSAEQRRVRRPFRALVAPGAPEVLASVARKDPARLWKDNLVRAEALSDAALTRLAETFAEADDWVGPLRYYKNLYKPFRERFAAVRDVPKVSVPTLVLWGAQDAFVLAEGAPLSCGWVAERCEVTVFEEAGHWPQWDVPEQVLARWRAFVSSPR